MTVYIPVDGSILKGSAGRKTQNKMSEDSEVSEVNPDELAKMMQVNINYFIFSKPKMETGRADPGEIEDVNNGILK